MRDIIILGIIFSLLLVSWVALSVGRNTVSQTFIPKGFNNTVTGIRGVYSDNQLSIRRNTKEYNLKLTKKDERIDCLCSTKKSCYLFVLLKKNNSGEWRLLKLALPSKGISLEKVAISELLNSQNTRIVLAKLYDKQKHGTIDNRTLKTLKTVSRNNFTITHIYDVSGNGKYLLLRRGNLNLLKVEPITTSYLPLQPWLYDVQSNRFNAVYPEQNESK